LMPSTTELSTSLGVIIFLDIQQRFCRKSNAYKFITPTGASIMPF
jgi:hypothetical protein